MSSRKLAIEYLPVASLRPDAKNARLHTPKQVQQIARSIEAFGLNVPVLADADSHVIAGHGRLRACELLGITQVPVIRLEHLSEHQKRAFMIADNRLTENAEWDRRLLSEQLKALSEVELNFTLEATGFELEEIDLMIENLNPVSAGPGDPADILPQPSSVQVSRIGDLWQLGKHRILCGDALSHDSYRSLLGDCRAHAVFTEPPCNPPIAKDARGKRENHFEPGMASGESSEAEFTRFLTDTFARLVKYTLPGSLHYICMGRRRMKEALAAGGVTYAELKDLCVWVKNNPVAGSLYRSQHELIFVFEHGKRSHRHNVMPGEGARSRTNVWNYPGANFSPRRTNEGNLLAFGPMDMPVALVADAIKDSSAPGGLVLDPFLGSGTTLVAAERAGRICRGLELDPRSVDTAIRRWQSFTGNGAFHVDEGRSFDELEKEAASERRRR